MDSIHSTLPNGTVQESIESTVPSNLPEPKPNGILATLPTAETPTFPTQTNPNGFFPSPPEQDGYDSCVASAIEAASSAVGSDEQRIQAYAKLEFADGDFYMTTYAVELGRDRLERSSSPSMLSNGLSATRSGSKNQSTDSVAGSVKVEEEDEDGVKNTVKSSQAHEEMPDGESGKDEAESTTLFSQRLSQKSSIDDTRKDYNALAVGPLNKSNVQPSDLNMEEFDLSAPLDCPLIPIQQPQKFQGRTMNKKSISRRHARIAFNFEKHYFELLFLGRNGGFLDDEWFAPGDIQPLVNGSVIQIGGLGIRFVLPDVPPGETGADEAEDVEYFSDGVEGNSNEDPDGDLEEMSPIEDNEKMKTRGRGKSKPETELGMVKSRRKGPGRPPKNGVMSKREQAQLAKQAKDDNKKSGLKKTTATLGRGKGKTAKALALEESSIQPSGKRKYTKRKRGGDENGVQNVRESTEKTESIPPEQTPASKVSKEKRALKPPRSPSPVWDESKLTPEQLAKPQASYVILIHEALTNSKTGAMSLPQIYRAIERKYPYFKLRVTTQGWQSSVRHNLGQHAAFRKIERDGKGWMWGYDPDISIEKERKRRATPPPQSTSQPRYYPQPQVQQPRPNYPYPGAQFPNGQVLQNSQLSSNSVPAVNGYNVPPGMQHGPLPPRPPFAASGFPMILNAKSDNSYRSPYDPNLTADEPSQSNSQTQPKVKASGMNGTQRPTSTLSQQALPHYPSYQYPSIPVKAQGAPYPSLVNRTLNLHAQSAIQKFKTALLNDMDDKPHAETIINSAVNRILGTTVTSNMTSDSDLSQEKTIMAALDKLLDDLGERPKDGKQLSHPKDPAEGGRAAEVAEEVVKSMPLVASEGQAGVQPSTPEGANGTNNGLKHKRSASGEGGEDQPPEKKLSV